MIEGVNVTMNIITPYELGKISVHKIILYLRKSRSEGKESVEEVLARHEKILQDFAIQTSSSFSFIILYSLYNKMRLSI